MCTTEHRESSVISYLLHFVRFRASLLLIRDAVVASTRKIEHSPDSVVSCLARVGLSPRIHRQAVFLTPPRKKPHREDDLCEHETCGEKSSRVFPPAGHCLSRCRSDLHGISESHCGATGDPARHLAHRDTCVQHRDLPLRDQGRSKRSPDRGLYRSDHAGSRRTARLETTPGASLQCFLHGRAEQIPTSVGRTAIRSSPR